MMFTDLQLKECYKGNFTVVAGRSNELSQVCALLAVHDVFQMLEGPHSSRAHETLDHLLAPALRPSLRQWYRRPDLKLDREGARFRNRLNQLAGERLEDCAVARPVPLSA